MLNVLLFYYMYYVMIVYVVVLEVNGECICVWMGDGGLGLLEILMSKKENDYDDSYF